MQVEHLFRGRGSSPVERDPLLYSRARRLTRQKRTGQHHLTAGQVRPEAYADQDNQIGVLAGKEGLHRRAVRNEHINDFYRHSRAVLRHA